MTIAEKLKYYRRISCMSQEKLAEASGISIRTIQRIEEGKSNGSGYTINALALALNISSVEFVKGDTQNPLPISNNDAKLKLLNLSAIAMLLIPLANILFPAYIYWKNKDDESVKATGGKIVSFQILWTFGTILASIVITSVLLLLFSALKTGSVPLFVPVYFTSAFLNIYFIVRFAININRQLPILEKIPNLL